MNKIYLEGTHNTRDLGGYLLPNDIIKSGILFRSDKLKNLTKDDIIQIKNLGIQRIIDFRSEIERLKEPNVIIESIEYIEMPIEVDKKINKKINEALNNKQNMKQFLIEANRDFVKEYKDVFSKFLKEIIKKPVPTLFHCTAGKDRTGFATYLIYKILGLDDETILEDYMKTNYFINETINDQLENIIKLMNINTNEEMNGNKAYNLLPLLTVDLEYINSAINTAIKNYGSIENFIYYGLNISYEEQHRFKVLMLSKY